MATVQEARKETAGGLLMIPKRMHCPECGKRHTIPHKTSIKCCGHVLEHLGSGPKLPAPYKYDRENGAWDYSHDQEWEGRNDN